MGKIDSKNVSIKLEYYELFIDLYVITVLGNKTLIQNKKGSFVCLVGWLGFMAYQPLQVIKCQIHYYTNEQFYFKQFSLAWVLCLIVKTISISSYSV